MTNKMTHGRTTTKPEQQATPKASTPAEIAKNVAAMTTADATRMEPIVTLRPARVIHGFVLPKGLADVRGWKVLGSDSQEVGTVDAFLVDTAGVEVRWLAVSLNDALRGEKSDTRISVMVPVGRVHHMQADKTVALMSIGREHLMKAPRITPGLPVTSDVEDATLAMLGMATSKDSPIAERYADPAFDMTQGLQPRMEQA